MNQNDSMYLTCLIASLWLDDTLDARTTEILMEAVSDRSDTDTQHMIDAIKAAIM